MSGRWLRCDYCGNDILGDAKSFVTMGPQVLKHYHPLCLDIARDREKAEPPPLSFFEQDKQQIASLKTQVVTLLRRLGEVEGRSIRANREADEALDAMRENVKFLAERLAQANGRLALRGRNADELVRLADQRAATAEAKLACATAANNSLLEQWRRDTAKWQTRALDAEEKLAGVTVPVTDSTEYYVVICRDDVDANGKPGHYTLATRQMFKTYERANEYCDGISSSREPLIIPGRWADLRWRSQL
jgi:hypothetical protein